jgi:hypothetical protein
MMSAPSTGRTSDAAADYAPHVRQARQHGVRGLVFRAERGDPDPLRDYLLQVGVQVPAHPGEPALALSMEDCRALARLIERKVPRTGGRPKESFSTGNAALRCAVYLTQIGRKAWFKRHGRKRASKNAPPPTDHLIKCAIGLVEHGFPDPDIRGKLKPGHVRAFVEGPAEDRREFKPKLTRSQVERYFDDLFFDEAVWLMKTACD